MIHSPFPWRTHPQAPTGVFDGTGRRIANTRAGLNIDEDTAEDNAALIVRAVNGLPKAIAALEGIVADMERKGMGDWPTAKQARTALTKLKG